MTADPLALHERRLRPVGKGSDRLFQKFQTHPVARNHHSGNISELLQRGGSRFGVTATECPGALDVVACAQNNERFSPTDVKLHEQLHVRGWSYALGPPTPFEHYFFIVDGERFFAVDYGVERSDLQLGSDAAALRRCGFDVRFSVAPLAPGEHTLTFLGRCGERLQSFGRVVTFHVLAAAVTARAPSLSLPLRGRIRTVCETHRIPRHDGRADRSIRRRASLTIGGWIELPTSASDPDVAVILSGHGRAYRIAAQRRFEPETGVALGDAAAPSCGYLTCVAGADLLPGVYEIAIEAGRGQHRTSVASGEWVEIMDVDSTWLPSALPVYRTPLEGELLAPLVQIVTQNDDFLIRGIVRCASSVAGIFARIDGGATYALTSGMTMTAHDAGRASCQAQFGAILATRFTVGRHELEILALDSTMSGVWKLAVHTFEVVPLLPNGEPLATERT